MKNRYNTVVRKCISNEYIKCSAKKRDSEREYISLCQKMSNEKETLTYAEYISIKAKADFLFKSIEELAIELNIWDKAREICLNAADES